MKLAGLLALSVSAAALLSPAPSHANLLAGTPAGAWSRYELRAAGQGPGGGPGRMTLSRLPDENAQAVVEVLLEPSGTGGPTALRMWLDPSVLRQGEDPRTLARHVKRLAIQITGMPATEVPVERVGKLLDLLATNPEAKLQKGDATVLDGIPCVRYTYQGSVTIPVLGQNAPLQARFAGEIWLSDQVPFRRVRERVTSTDPHGNEVTTEWVLVAHGEKGAVGHIEGKIVGSRPRTATSSSSAAASSRR